MKTMNQIGLDKEKVNKVAEKLNGLLSDVQIFYMNVRGYHWNIKGKEFFMLHSKFEELYEDLADKADEIAERILMLEGKPVHSFSDYIRISGLKESKNKTGAGETAKEVLDGLKLLIQKEREILDLASEINDEGTVALMSDYILAQEKTVWMFSAYLS